MLDFIKDKKECIGCTACFASCPVHCIKMVEDEEGFTYPIANDLCIHCGKCKKVCPVQNYSAPTNNFNQSAYAAVTKNFNIWKQSSSGGAFTEICLAWGNENTYFVGATWNGGRVEQTMVKGVDEISLLCKSKYISSDLNNVFYKVKEKLDNGSKVLFCGVPCQIAGLRAFLGKNYADLLLIDLICHGAGSPKVFNSCLRKLEKQFASSIYSYEFRAKNKYYETDYLTKIVYENNTENMIVNDPYIQLFLKQLCLRPSCGQNCLFRNSNRQGDITLADFKGLYKVFPKLVSDMRNYSAIIFNNQKGYKVFKTLTRSMDVLPCDIEMIKLYNPLFYRQTWFNENRNKFFAEYINDKEYAVEKWTTDAEIYHENIKRKFFYLMPRIIRSGILKVVRNIENRE